MRKPAPYVSLDDCLVDVGDVGAGAGGVGWQGEGLCCPDDPLDEVMNFVTLFDEPFLEALGCDCSPPRGAVSTAPATAAGAVGAEGMDVADAGAVPSVGALGVGKPGAFPVTVSAGGLDAPPGLVFQGAAASAAGHAALSSSASTAWTTSSGYCLSSASWETESSAPELSASMLSWTVRRKKWRRHPAVVRKRAWSLDFPLHLVQPTVPAGRYVDSAQDIASNAGVLSARHNGGSYKRRMAGRHRSRKEPRKCHHCHTSETPQWRTGPDGPGTLCNACGIRYKHVPGGLVAEYRPSTSPGFRKDEHSNRHKNVVKLREMKQEDDEAVLVPVPLSEMKQEKEEAVLVTVPLSEMKHMKQEKEAILALPSTNVAGQVQSSISLAS